LHRYPSQDNLGGDMSPPQNILGGLSSSPNCGQNSASCIAADQFVSCGLRPL
jgi:hypothetical protein